MISTLEEVPPNWIKVKFEYIARNITKRIDNPAESGLEYYIGLEHLDTDQIRIKRFGSTDDVKATKFICKKGDIIFGKRNAYLRKVAVTDRDAVVSAHSMVIRPKGDLIVPEFLPCFMQSSVFWKTAHAISEGSMSPTIKWKTLAKQEFWIPSIAEQKKIAEILWIIEGNIEKNEKLLGNTEKVKNRLLSELLTNGVGHRTVESSNVTNKYQDWKTFRLSDIVTIIGGGTPKTSLSSYWNGEIPWISVEDFDPDSRYLMETKKSITKDGLENSSTKILPENSLIISARGTVGLVSQLLKPMAFNQSCYGLVGKENILNDFLYHLLIFKLNELKHNSYGSTFSSITRKNFDLIYVDVPSIDEQKQIVSILDGLIKLKSNYQTNIFKVIDLKKKLINELLSGRIRIPEEALRNVQ